MHPIDTELMLKPFADVRIRQLLQTEADYDGWGFNERPPQIGDVGTLVDVLKALGLPNKYVVESSAPDGRTIWLSDFFAEELELA